MVSDLGGVGVEPEEGCCVAVGARARGGGRGRVGARCGCHLKGRELCVFMRSD